MDLVSETSGDAFEIRIYREYETTLNLEPLKEVLRVLQNFHTDHFQQIIFNYKFIIPHLQLFIDKRPWYLTKVYSNIPMLQEKILLLPGDFSEELHVLETAKQQLEKVFLNNPHHLIRMPTSLISHLLTDDLFLKHRVDPHIFEWLDPIIVDKINTAQCIYHKNKFINEKKQDIGVIFSKFPKEIVSYILGFVHIDTSKLVFELKQVVTPDDLVYNILHNTDIPCRYKIKNRSHNAIEIIVKPSCI